MGETPIKIHDGRVSGAFVERDGERFYKISQVDQMPAFFISLVSASDHWMFISSKGSLSAGRKNPEGALFPYYSEDKIHDYAGQTGSRTLILVKEGERMKLWEPFTGTSAGAYSVKRNLYKNLLGNKLIFEEINEDLDLSFSYGWYNSEKFGFVRRSELKNHASAPKELEVLDGLLNILPCSVDSGLQLSSSNLLDAYKRQELVPGTTLGIFRLSSVPSDAAAPSEALRANTLWSEGLAQASILLSGLQVDDFRSGKLPLEEKDIKATRGAYFVHAPLHLTAGAQQEWNIVAEVNQDASAVAALNLRLKSGEDLRQEIRQDIDHSSMELYSLLSSSDAMQCTQDELSSSRHLSNVLFNVMRGGLFLDNYWVPAEDFLSHVSGANLSLLPAAKELVEGKGLKIHYKHLLEKARSAQDPNLERLCYEYLALSFSRRHGDPSRPWNKFSIDNRHDDGSRKLDYQGNWRDIFQNWEALALSFPGYTEGMISKFVNASTPDGYNPYRITRHGVDWEVHDPSDPWSNIGYWGDHQVIYLLKFLEISVHHHPGQLQQLLSRELFSYANVPYRIKPYGELLTDPHNTIVFDHALEQVIQSRVQELGSDGKLVWDNKQQVLRVNLAEKLLLVLLAKWTNFIPGAGIWMNTQRPEWNDANNALVGFGVSLVTASYLRAYVAFCRNLFDPGIMEKVSLTVEVAEFFRRMSGALKEQLQEAGHMLTDRGMKACMDLFGEAGSDYRQGIYPSGFSGQFTQVDTTQILEFFDHALMALDATLRSNRRDDRLFHSYNLIRVDGQELRLRRLYEMLEGQVAILSSGFLQAEEAVDLLDALKKSQLFREDQYSYILYPNRKLPSFLEINKIPEEELIRSVLLQTLLERSDRQILSKDVNGIGHFHADFRNADALKEALDALPEEYATLLAQERSLVLEIYEKLFDHQSFTGRSGTFYGYEGLGSIYWHMVSKLLLAVCETYYRAADEQEAGPETLGRLAAHYYEIRAGIGLNKEPDVYGAFPTDPYSHTPGNKGAQQPGMTGQVKEDILARWGELGVVVREGALRFHPILLRRKEFLSKAREFVYQDVFGERHSRQLEKDSLGFTYCQIPLICHLSDEKRILLHFSDGTDKQVEGLSLDQELSQKIFERGGEIACIEMWLSPGL
jgi:hypothetical protein